MEFKIRLNEKEKHILKRMLAIVLSISFMATGVYAIAFFEKIGVIKGQIQIVSALLLHVLQWWLVIRAVIKHYR